MSCTASVQYTICLTKKNVEKKHEQTNRAAIDPKKNSFTEKSENEKSNTIDIDRLIRPKLLENKKLVF